MSFEGIALNRPIVDTFDSGYEHSLDHLLDLKALLADDTETNAPQPLVESVAAVSSAA